MDHLGKLRMVYLFSNMQNLALLTYLLIIIYVFHLSDHLNKTGETMEASNKLRIFRKFFTARPDVYAYRLQEGDNIPKNLQIGAYVPRRAPRYRLTDHMIISHMRGDVMLGAYPLQKDGDCPWIAADFDAHNGVSIDDSLALATAFREVGIEPLCCSSKSGLGVHVRLIFDKPIQAWIMRRLVNILVFEECGLERLSDGGAYDRCFPAQDLLRKDDPKAIGNQIVMPLNMKAAERKGCLILDRQFNPIPLGDATWDFLEIYENNHIVTRAQVMSALVKLGRMNVLSTDPENESVLGREAKNFVPNITKKPSPYAKGMPTTGDLKSMVANCRFFRYALESSLSYFEWLALAANLAPYDHCGGRETFHRISEADNSVDKRGHPRYCEDDCEQKFQDVVSHMQPITCQKIAEEGWQCLYLGGDNQCNKFRRLDGRGPRAPAAVPRFLH
jgi:hypothetical protein